MLIFDYQLYQARKNRRHNQYANKSAILSAFAKYINLKEIYKYWCTDYFAFEIIRAREACRKIHLSGRTVAISHLSALGL